MSTFNDCRINKTLASFGVSHVVFIKSVVDNFPAASYLPFLLVVVVSPQFPSRYVVILPLDEHLVFLLLEDAFDGKCLSRCDGYFFIWCSGKEGSPGTGTVVLSLQRVYVCMGLNECARCTRRIR